KAGNGINGFALIEHFVIDYLGTSSQFSCRSSDAQGSGDHDLGKHPHILIQGNVHELLVRGRYDRFGQKSQEFYFKFVARRRVHPELSASVSYGRHGTSLDLDGGSG